MTEERNLLTRFDDSRRWNGSAKGRLLVVGTRCFGDMIKWSRFFPVMESSGVDWKLFTWPELVPLFRRLLPPDKIVGSDEPIPDHDFWVPVLWLHAFFGEHEKTLALRITAAPDKIAKYRSLRKDTPVVGLCRYAAEWMMTHKWRRLEETEVSKIISATPHVTWINLQYGRTYPDIVNMPFETWDDTAGLIHNLDGVVSCDTSVPHFAGAMGKRTMVLHGRAETSVTQYQEFETHYPGVIKAFYPDYGNPNTCKTATDKFLDFIKEKSAFWT